MRVGGPVDGGIDEWMDRSMEDGYVDAGWVHYIYHFNRL